MVVSFNRYLPVILPEIEECGLNGAVATEIEPSDNKQRASYTVDETIERSCPDSVGDNCSTTTPVATSSAAVTVPLCVLGEVQLRFLCPDDLEEVRSLCQDWFPIGEYAARMLCCNYHARARISVSLNTYRLDMMLFLFLFS